MQDLASRHRAELLCALLLVLMALNFLSVLPRKNLTIDETLAIPAGFYHLGGDFRPVSEHPPLAKIWAALPLLFTNTQAPPLDPNESYPDPYMMSRKFWVANDAHYEALRFWAQVPMVGVALLLGTLIFIFARRLFGPRAALLAVALYTIEPTVLAHGRVVQTDVPSALAYLLFAFTIYSYWKTRNMRHAVCVGLSAGLALVTKFSMVPLVPMLSAVFLFAPRLGQKRRSVAAQLLVALAAVVLVVNAAYFFHHRAPEPYSVFLSATGYSQTSSEILQGLLPRAYAALQVIFPTDFIYGITFQLALLHRAHVAGLLGMYSDHGWWYYFPVAFALKTTLPFLLLALASVAWAVWKICRSRDERLVVLLAPILFFTGLVMMSSINIGVRHFLPAYPFLFILSGAFLDFLLARQGKRALATTLLVLLFGWMSLETVRTYPDYISYMNELASRAPHWYYLGDSNVEWGDDVRSLALYLRERGESRVSAQVWGWEMLPHYGIKNVGVPLDPAATQTRYVAVGASFLNGSVNGSLQRVNDLAAYRQLTPEKVIGGSIYLYRMKE